MLVRTEIVDIIIQYVYDRCGLSILEEWSEYFEGDDDTDADLTDQPE